MILLISYPKNSHTYRQTQILARELARLGRQDVYIVDLSAFPMRMSLSMSMSYASSGENRYRLQLADGSQIPMEEVRAIWWHHFLPFAERFEYPDALQPAHRRFAIKEAETALRGLWLTSDALWINDVQREEAASHKPWQLALAQDVGLSIPDTLITNNPEEARQYWAKYPGEIIYKAFHSTDSHCRLETRLLKSEEEALAASIQLTPVIFQRYIPARHDLRITIVGDRIFAAEIHTQQAKYQVDVRMDPHIPCFPHTLPADLEQKLLTFMKRLGLEYGAIDMRLTPDGEYVFLEINPSGYYSYIEEATGQPITRTLAEKLAQVNS
jgi:glutathione synthase/RimK-type ligase-like ATP-grasp enzyme